MDVEKQITKAMDGSAVEFRFDEHGSIFRVYNKTDSEIRASLSASVTMDTGLSIPAGGYRDLCDNANPRKSGVYNKVYVIGTSGNVEVQELWF